MRVQDVLSEHLSYLEFYTCSGRVHCASNFGVKISFDNFCWIKRRIKICPNFTWKMQLLKNGNVWHIHGWQMRTLFPASSLSRRGETSASKEARSSVTSWGRCLVVIDLISVQTLFIFGKLFSERGVSITFIGPLNCLPEKYILNTYQRNISLSGKIVT